jgi:hypothetical protein
MGLRMTHVNDEEPRRRSNPRPYYVVDQLLERLTMLPSQLESTVKTESRPHLPPAPHLGQSYHLITHSLE